MSAPEPEGVIVLNVLRVASRDVIGKTEPLSVAKPCQFSNAQGNLRPVSDFEELRGIALDSGRDLANALRKTS